MDKADRIIGSILIMVIAVIIGLGIVQLINGRNIQSFIDVNNQTLLEDSVNTLYPENVKFSSFKTHYTGKEETHTQMCIAGKLTDEQLKKIDVYIQEKYHEAYNNSIYKYFFNEDELKVYLDTSGLNIRVEYTEKFSLSRFRHSYSGTKAIPFEKYTLNEEDNK